MTDAIPSRRILLIEDNLDFNELLGSQLIDAGHSVTAAYDGVAGLGIARTHVFDVLICDIGLPSMDGFELITRLRQPAGAHIPFAIAISGNGNDSNRMRAIGAGYGQYFVKPVDIAALLTLIASETLTRIIGTLPATR